MATMVLTVAGGLIGGPFGAQLGGLIGGAIDRQLLFKPATREGARLADLRVQTSSYGTAIPQLFGTIRVAGCVIWATDLIEHRATQSGGKGQPSTTSYSYTASFAVALSSRPIVQVGRIWADGQLLRGAAGDFKVRTGFRLHDGGEDQAVDPLIAAIEGVEHAPAHRGLAYAVFEDLELASFGNRLPQLSFEVIADATPVSAGSIAAGVAPLAAGGLTTALHGFSTQDSVRTTLEALCTASGGWLCDGGDGLALVSGAGTARKLPDGGAAGDDARGTRDSRSVAAPDSTPRRLSIGYYDPARDYQAGVQQASRPGASWRETRVDLPAVLDADAAKAMAADALARAERVRERRTLTLGWDALAVAPGARISIEGVPGQWRVDRWALEKMVVKLECVPIADAPAAGPASAGRSVAAPDSLRGHTILAPFELPPLDDDLAAVPRIVVAAAGTGSGWRRAALLASNDGGMTWRAQGETAYPAVLGTVRVPPGAGRAALADHVSVVEVDLAHPAMLLLSADEAARDAGANLAMLGDELLQFGVAEPLGGTRWRLSQLWRGRRGTEPAIGTAQAGDRFVLLERVELKTLDLSANLGSTVKVLAQGVDDPVDAAPAVVALGGISFLPPSPVHLNAAPDGDGTRLSWVRRSRVGWDWRDGVDAPLGEESEQYQIDLESGDERRTLRSDRPSVLVTGADRRLPWHVRVRQVGTHGLSPAAELLLPALGDDR